jgi:hypothetical protein
LTSIRGIDLQVWLGNRDDHIIVRVWKPFASAGVPHASLCRTKGDIHLEVSTVSANKHTLERIVGSIFWGEDMHERTPYHPGLDAQHPLYGVGYPRNVIGLAVATLRLTIKRGYTYAGSCEQVKYGAARDSIVQRH